jgi:hypothetical protein
VIFVTHAQQIFELTPCRGESRAARVDRHFIVGTIMRGT